MAICQSSLQWRQTMIRRVRQDARSLLEWRAVLLIRKELMRSAGVVVLEPPFSSLERSTPCKRLGIRRLRIKHHIDLFGMKVEEEEARLFETNGTIQMSKWVFHRDGRQVFEFRKTWK